MFGNARPQFQHGRRQPPPTPQFNPGGHGHFQPTPPSSYRNQQPSFDDDDDDEWDDSDEEVYENEVQQSNPPPVGRRDRQPLPPGRPMHNPPDHPPMRPPHTNYPQHRPPALQPRDNHISAQPEEGDDFYMPIDPSQETNRPMPRPGFNSSHAPGPVSPSRPSYPPPSSTTSRPPMPTPASNSMHDIGGPADRFGRAERNVPSSRPGRNRTSPGTSPGPPSRESSGRSSGGSVPHRGGSGGSRSSQDSTGSGDRPNGGRPLFLPPNQSETPPKSGTFESFKHGFKPGFDKQMNPPDISNKPAALPQFSHKRPDKPAKPSSGFNLFDRKPNPAPKPGREKPAPPFKEKATSAVNAKLAGMFSKKTPRPSEVSSDHTTSSLSPPSRLPNFQTRPVEVEQQVWFRDVRRNEAQSMIERSRPMDGCFIVRPGRTPNPYSLTVFSGGLCNLVIRRRSDNNYALGTEKLNEKSFTTVVELIEYHMENPLVLAEGKGEVRLTGPPQV